MQVWDSYRLIGKTELIAKTPWPKLFSEQNYFCSWLFKNLITSCWWLKKKNQTKLKSKKCKIKPIKSPRKSKPNRDNPPPANILSNKYQFYFTKITHTSNCLGKLYGTTQRSYPSTTIPQKSPSAEKDFVTSKYSSVGVTLHVL